MSVRRIAAILDRAYPTSNLGNKSNPLDELAYVMLSGQTAEKNYQESYLAFKRAFPRWATVAEADEAAIAKSIWHGGLAKQKAAYLAQIARSLRNEHGAVTLSFLHASTTHDAEHYLLSLPGVGLKTARCVLMYSLHRQVFPVDTHCARLVCRLGLVERDVARSGRFEDVAQDAIPPDLRSRVHIRFVQHGRAVCRPTPLCSACVLNRICPSSEAAL